MKKIVGNKLKDVINRNGATVYNIGKESGMLKGGRIYNIANNKEILMSVQNAYTLSQLLDVSMEDLFIIE